MTGLDVVARWGLAAALLLAYSGCMRHRIDPHPQPMFDMPPAFTAGPSQTGPPSAPWWETFDDPRLSELVETALRSNFTVAQGLARVDRAVALRRQVQALRGPQVDLRADAERRWTRDLDPPRPPRDTSTIDLPPIQVTPGPAAKQTTVTTCGGPDGSGRNRRARGREQWETEASVGLGLSWELDLWGRLRARALAEGEEVAAAVDDYEALRLALSAQVALAYFEASEQRLQLALLDEQRNLARTFLELLELRFIQGAASAVDVLQQRGQVAEIEAEMPVAQAQLRLLENRIDVLLGGPPDGLDRTADPVALPADTALPALEVPATLLQRRPDLRALQRRVVAEDYRVGAAMADRLPQLRLDGTFGLTDSSDSSLLAGAAGLDLFQPLIDWGRRRAAVTEQQAALQETLLAFSEQYLVAIEEVETTLWREARQRELIDALVAREHLLARTVEETRVRYSLGVTDYLPVLTALQDLQQVQRELLQARRELVSLRIQLHLATGG